MQFTPCKIVRIVGGNKMSPNGKCVGDVVHGLECFL